VQPTQKCDSCRGKERYQTDLWRYKIELSRTADLRTEATVHAALSDSSNLHSRCWLQRFDNITAPPCALLSHSVGRCAPRGGLSRTQFPSVMLTNTTLNLSSRTPAATCSIEFASSTPLVESVSSFFSRLPGGTPVALESVGNWYWIADEIAAAGCLPLLTNPAKAKLMMGHVNKTDRLDANGLATLLRIGMPTMWLPPASLRDQRELPRTRMALTALRTSIKNRIHSLLAKYNLSPVDGTQLFSKKGRSWLDSSLSRLPPETGAALLSNSSYSTSCLYRLSTLEERIYNLMALTPTMPVRLSLPRAAVRSSGLIRKTILSVLFVPIDPFVGCLARNAEAFGQL